MVDLLLSGTTGWPVLDAGLSSLPLRTDALGECRLWGLPAGCYAACRRADPSRRVAFERGAHDGPQALSVP